MRARYELTQKEFITLLAEALWTAAGDLRKVRLENFYQSRQGNVEFELTDAVEPTLDSASVEPLTYSIGKAYGELQAKAFADVAPSVQPAERAPDDDVICKCGQARASEVHSWPISHEFEPQVVIADDGINRAELQTEASVASEGDMAAYDPQTYVLIDPPPLRKLCEKTEYCELYEGHEGDCDDGIPF